jgi:very-short-patch-repair endonuclease
MRDLLERPQHHQIVKPTQRKNARVMRRIATDAERKLWLLLRDRRLDGLKFRRQAPFGPFILDFVCLDRKLVLEVDGGQHGESARDEARDVHLRAEGFQIVRYWNNDVLKNPEGVLTDLLARLTASDSASAARVIMPSPLVGEGSSESQRRRTGEG